MILSARTALKARGVDEIKTKIVSDMELKQLPDEMIANGERNTIPFFIRDGKCMAVSDACVLNGIRGAVLHVSTARDAVFQPVLTYRTHLPKKILPMFLLPGLTAL